MGSQFNKEKDGVIIAKVLAPPVGRDTLAIIDLAAVDLGVCLGRPRPIRVPAVGVENASMGRGSTARFEQGGCSGSRPLVGTTWTLRGEGNSRMPQARREVRLSPLTPGTLWPPPVPALPTDPPGQVDAQEHQALAAMYGVQGYPTLKWMPKGKKLPGEAEAVNAPRDAEGLGDFVSEKAGIKRKGAPKVGRGTTPRESREGRGGGDMRLPPVPSVPA